MVYQFGPFSLDDARYDLRKAGVIVSVEPKVFDVLVFLICHRDRVVGKSELLEQVWNGEVVSEWAISRCITEARRALEDTGSDQRYIQTSRGRGYRFVAEVMESGPGEKAMPQSGTLTRVLLFALTFFVLLIGSIWASWPQPIAWLLKESGLTPVDSAPEVPVRPSVVVLPLDNASKDPNHAYLSDGITAELISFLARIPGMLVISQSSSFTYKGNLVLPEQAARELGVRYVIYGSVKKKGEKVEVRIELLDAATGFQVEARTYERDISMFGALPRDIATEVVNSLALDIRDAEVERQRNVPMPELGAYQALLRGSSYMHRYRHADLLKARALFERAIEIDPEFTQSHAALAGTYIVERRMLWSLDTKLLPNAKKHAAHALAIDPGFAPTYVVLAAIAGAEGDHDKALQLAKRAILLSPNLAQAHLIAASSLLQQGEHIAAISFWRQGLRLTPRTPAWMLHPFASLHYMLGDQVQAIHLWQRARQENPDLIAPRLLLLETHREDGDSTKSKTLVDEILRTNPELSADTAVHELAGFLDPEAQDGMVALLRAQGLR